MQNKTIISNNMNKCCNPIGIMQGRLLPQINGKLQAFPVKGWEKEFVLAQECGFDSIELIFDIDGIEHNPLASEEGCQKIQELSKCYHIKTLSICGNYFMSKGFIRTSKEEITENTRMLEKLTRRCRKIGAKYITLPLLGRGEVKTEKELLEVERFLLGVVKATNDCDVTYALEVSLPADIMYKFLKKINNPRLKINYDTGNSTIFGYDVVSEIKKLGSLITGVHIKDVKNGENYLLGNGDTDFDGAFSAFAAINYKGPFILEAQRGLDEIKTAKKGSTFTRKKILQYCQKTKENK